MFIGAHVTARGRCEGGVVPGKRRGADGDRGVATVGGSQGLGTFASYWIGRGGDLAGGDQSCSQWVQALHVARSSPLLILAPVCRGRKTRRNCSHPP